VLRERSDRRAIGGGHGLFDDGATAGGSDRRSARPYCKCGEATARGRDSDDVGGQVNIGPKVCRAPPRLRARTEQLALESGGLNASVDRDPAEARFAQFGSFGLRDNGEVAPGRCQRRLAERLGAVEIEPQLSAEAGREPQRIHAAQPVGMDADDPSSSETWRRRRCRGRRRFWLYVHRGRAAAHGARGDGGAARHDATEQHAHAERYGRRDRG